LQIAISKMLEAGDETSYLGLTDDDVITIRHFLGKPGQNWSRKILDADWYDNATTFKTVLGNLLLLITIVRLLQSFPLTVSCISSGGGGSSRASFPHI